MILPRIAFAERPLLSDSLVQLHLPGGQIMNALVSQIALFYLFIFLITKY
jgi:hypothetical protein